MTLYRATAEGNIAMTPAEEDEFELSRAPVIVIPQSVTMRQARLALNAAGYYAAVNAAVAVGSDADKIEWEFAGDVYRSAGLVPRMASSLGLTSTQIDGLFIAAATL